MPARALIIEDNQANLDLMTYLLTAFGHTALGVPGGQEGLELALHEPIDLVLCDIQLQGMNGYEVVRQLKGHPHLHNLPVVAVTAYAMVGDRDRILSAGFDGYIAKPIMPENFVHQVEAFLPPALRSTPRPPPEPAVTDLVPPPRTKRATVLLVDDSPVNAAVACSILEPFGYEVVVAEGVEEALRRARQSPPDLILSDFHLHQESAADLLRALRADPALAAIPLVIVSSTARHDWPRAQELAAGAHRFILRPIEPHKFLAELEQILQGLPGSSAGAPDPAA